MITQELIELQNWYVSALKNASKFAHLPVQRQMFKDDARQAKKEFLETYGVELPL